VAGTLKRREGKILRLLTRKGTKMTGELHHLVVVSVVDDYNNTSP